MYYEMLFSAIEDYLPLIDGVRVIFNPGEFKKTVTVDTVNDGIAEGTEMFTGTFSPNTAGVGVFNPQAAVFISEDGMKSNVAC